MAGSLADVTVILDEVRSLYNVGAVMRACDGAGIQRLIACGITPYPAQGQADPRRGPVSARADRELRKTALAAFDTVRVEHCPGAADAIAQARREGAMIVAIERAPHGEVFWRSPAMDAPRLALVFGHEVEGLAPPVISLADAVVEVPMLGAGHSLNVAVTAGIVLYEVVRRRTSPRR
ncbi:MAG: TrmH family RNA methyltransferase, partial [Chloroflexota bacterium]